MPDDTRRESMSEDCHANGCQLGYLKAITDRAVTAEAELFRRSAGVSLTVEYIESGTPSLKVEGVDKQVGWWFIIRSGPYTEEGACRSFDEAVRRGGERLLDFAPKDRP